MKLGSVDRRVRPSKKSFCWFFRRPAGAILRAMRSNEHGNGDAASSANGHGRLLTQREAAIFLGGVSERSLERWRCIGFGPPYLKFGKFVRYRQADLSSWLASHLVTPGPDHLDELA